MKIIQINAVYNYGSTGKIVYQIQQYSQKKGFNNIVAYGYYNNKQNKKNNTYYIGNWLDCHIHNRIAKYTKKKGFYSRLNTYKFIQYLKKEKPDIVHIHNIHDSYINISILFLYLKKENIKVVWTLHDCWPFTGNCSHYEMFNCLKWKDGCHNCHRYASIFSKEQSSKNWLIKKYLYSNMTNMVIVTPSVWIANEVKKSFLKNNNYVVIKNGINTKIFRPTPSSFREEYRIKSKYIILGVAFDWGVRKGLDVFIELSRRLMLNEYQIVLVGTNSENDKKLPDSIISIHRLKNQQELAAIYSAADLFVNPTREEMFGLVNIEALACGTPGLTFRAGGSPECFDEACGSTVDINDIDAVEKEIIRICNRKPFSKNNCIKKAKEYDIDYMCQKYVDLYLSM